MKEAALKKAIKHYPQETEGYWKQQQTAWLVSGLSRKQYCRKQGINYDRFQYWLKKLSPQSGAAQSAKNTPVSNASLLPVTVSQTKQNTPPIPPLCTLHLSNGHHLAIHHERALLILLEQWRS
jgi:hypothetical protein